MSDISQEKATTKKIVEILPKQAAKQFGEKL